MLLKNKLKKVLLEQQQNCCYYCYQEMGKACYFKKKVIALRPELDHVLPYSYKQDNSNSNIVVACQVCNSVKGSKVFDSMDMLVAYIHVVWLGKDKKCEVTEEKGIEQWQEKNVRNVKVTLKQQESGNFSAQSSVAMLGIKGNMPLLLAPTVKKLLTVIKRRYKMKRCYKLTLDDKVAMGMFREVPAKIVKINSRWYHIKKE